MANGNPWDFSNILLSNRAGELAGRGVESAGQSLAQGFQQYERNKEARNASTGAIEGIVKADPSILQVADPKLVEKMQAGDLDLAGTQRLLGQLTAAQATRQQQQQARLRDTQIQSEEAIMAQRAAEFSKRNQNSRAFQEMFAGQPQADDALKYIRRTPLAPQPMAADAETMLGRYAQAGGELTPEVVDLATRMQAARSRGENVMVFPSEAELQRRYPADRFDYQMQVNPANGQVAVRSISPRAPQNTVPPGYEPDPSKPGAVRPIPGSEGDVKRAEVEKAAEARRAAEVNRAAVVLNAVEQVIPRIDALTAGFGGTALSKIAGTEATDVAALIDTIKANVGFEQLQKMREASPTGGALGQIAVKELDFLQASLGNLSISQSPAQLKRTLGEVAKHYDRWRKAASGIDPNAEEKEASADEPLQIKSIKQIR